MKKKLLLVLFPAVLMIAGAVAVWGDDQAPLRPGCGKCPQAVEQKEAGAAAPAAVPGGAPCPKCVKPEAEMKPGCAKCAEAAQVKPGCANCARMNGAQAPAEPVQKGCCNKAKAQ